MSQSTTKAAETAKSRYFLIWRWHFYAGLFVVPFMLMLSVTGIIMLFDKEIELARHAERLLVETQQDQVPFSAQLEAVKSAYPNTTITQFITAQTEDTANRFSVRFADGQVLFATVDPYSGEVLGAIDRKESWHQLANDIHGTLLIGDTGDYLIEIAASLTILLLVTGIYLWLPSDNASKAGFLKIRRNNGTRTMMRDIHANLGGTLAIILLFFVISGLAWAGFWGGQFVQPWNTFPAQKWSDVPLSDMNHKQLNHLAEEEVPWNLELTPVPASHQHHVETHQNNSTGYSIDIDTLIADIESLGYIKYKLYFPRGETGVFTVSANTMSGDITNPTQDRTTHFDQYSGEVLADVNWNDYGVVAKLMAAGIALHQGDISVVNKVVNLLLCIAFIVISVTGIMMWWKRRPQNAIRLGAPPRFTQPGIWKSALVTLLLISVAFPLAGATILVVLAIDALIVKKVKRLNTALN
ncbi:PepSY-associated TM helix domain-containing protein [Thaumasiovibrio subtropicus]|uniref:PepSY-associated TM helix domain-containing protein n=1 Tax=Thaumasiovibrio subtropicus TaxID=1891207 RepID=UPI0039C9E7E5